LREPAADQVSEPTGLPYQTEQTPTIVEERTDAWLDGIRRQMLRILQVLESSRPENDGIAKKIAKLADQGALPGTICCMMRTLNSLRNLVVYENVQLGRHELAVATAAWACVQEWWKERQLAGQARNAPPS